MPSSISIAAVPSSFVSPPAIILNVSAKGEAENVKPRGESW
jgi:hypothetical protein